MTTWHQLRERAITSFGGETLNSTTEDALIAAFEQSPAWFISTLEQIENDYANGSIRSGWAILRKRVIDNANRPNPQVDARSDRASQVRLAERWIHQVGYMLPTRAELEDELFGHHGQLRDHAGDEALRERMLEHWQRRQPVNA